MYNVYTYIYIYITLLVEYKRVNTSSVRHVVPPECRRQGRQVRPARERQGQRQEHLIYNCSYHINININIHINNHNIHSSNDT